MPGLRLAPPLRKLFEMPAGRQTAAGRGSEPRGVPWEALLRPEAYPGDPSAAAGVERIQTHLSRVYRTGERVYKFRRALRLPFVDFSLRSERNADCLREVSLNRRLAPDVYLGVAPLEEGADGGARIGPVSEALRGGPDAFEHCVVMRRLPEGEDALSRLAAGRLSPADLDAVALTVARFHAAHALDPDTLPTGDAWARQCAAPFLDCFAVLRGAPFPGRDPAQVEALARRAQAGALRLAPLLEARRAEGRVVDGHGDLRLDHIWLRERSGPPEPPRDEAPRIIDCVEFSDALRRIDAASEVAFLAMDLAYRGHEALGEGFLASYAAHRDDFGLYPVVDWFGAYRATVRAKVAALAAGDAELEAQQRDRAAESAARHLDVAEALLSRRDRAAVIVLCGLVGSGKSTVARALADRLRAVAVASDRVRRAPALHARRRRTGLARYAPESIQAVYDAMLERAAPVVASGRPVVLDATHAEASRRTRVRDWARERGLRALLVEAFCPREETLRRLARRAERGDDASEAGPAQLEGSLARYEPPDEWPAADRLRVDTTGELEPALRPVAHWLARERGDA